MTRAETNTLSAFEAAARQTQTKGCFIERGAHPKAAAISKWLESQDEEDYQFGEAAIVSMNVAPGGGCGDSACADKACGPSSHATPIDVADTI